jgi:hypothetical protein
MSISNQLLFCAANNINDVYFFVRRSNLTHLFTESLPGKSRLCHKEKADFDFALEAIVRGREAIMGSLCLEMGKLDGYCVLMHSHNSWPLPWTHSPLAI